MYNMNTAHSEFVSYGKSIVTKAIVKCCILYIETLLNSSIFNAYCKLLFNAYTSQVLILI